MLLSLQSTGPRYNYIQTNIQIPWNCEYIKYYVASINTSNLLLTTDDDVIEFEYTNDDGEKKTVSQSFNDSYHVELVTALNKIKYTDDQMHRSVVDANYNEISHKIEITPLADNFKYTKITYRAGLVTGLYDIKLNEIYPRGVEIVGGIPIRNYNNKLYLISKQGQSIKSNIGDREYNPSVIANIDYPIKYNVPIIMNFEQIGKPLKNIVNIDSFKQIELELVDFQYKPVRLMSPMFVTIKIKPCDPPRMKLDQ